MFDAFRGRVRPVLSAVLAATLSACATGDSGAGLGWAYPPAGPAMPPPADPAALVRIPGSSIAFAVADTRNRFKVPDWTPDTHPAMPPVVSGGRQPAVMACGYCHLPTGNGRPENATLAGLPRTYFIAQMADFRSGARHSGVAGRSPTETMQQSAKAATEAEIEAAADYFSSMQAQSFVRVVEARRIPRVRAQAFLYVREPGGGTEPLGARIVETPDDFERFERRDPAIGYVAYVPPGSIALGRRLAERWGEGGAQACGTCHGPDHRGMGDIPGIAGRSPTAIVRQLADFRSGARKGANSAPMTLVTERMNDREIVALAAYLGTQRP